MELSALTGSDKQIRWADDIRSRVLEDIPDEFHDAAARILAARTSAKWWIDNQGYGGEEWVDLLGIREPALAPEWMRDPARRARYGSAAQTRVADSMQQARKIRDVLDAAGVARSDYVLKIHGMDGDRVAIMVPIEEPRLPRDDTWRAVPERLMAVLNDAGWSVGGASDRRKTLGDLGTGRGAVVLPPADTTA